MTDACTIDWDFIQSLEGFRIEGYVPSDTSGVTIGTGFDIGQHSKAALQAFGFTESTLTKLLPFSGLVGDDARGALNRAPLVLNTQEAQELDACVHKSYVSQIESEYNQNSDFVFSFLDSAKQTVIMSVGFQYGSLKTRCPNFFSAITQGLWQKAVDELSNFGDAYPTRRKKEAVLLASSLQ
jgi:hypothetical protein